MTLAHELAKPANPLDDAALQPFLQADFDPAKYLNSVLPALSTSADIRNAQHNAAPLVEVSAKAQAVVSKLSSQTTRLSNTLTLLTDEIIRSGGKLAYEVELLRGEATGLTETLQDGLKEEFQVFLAVDTPNEASVEEKEDSLDAVAAARRKGNQPDYLAKLHTLTAVRDRLDEVMKLFDEALKWPMAPPQATGLSTGLISVTSPVSAEESEKLDARGKEYVDDLRKELNGMLRQGGDGGSLALKKMQRLRAVAEVWKGTIEEKPRMQIIDDLQKLVNEQYKDDKTTSTSRPVMDYRFGGVDTKLGGENGYGFLSNLRNLKNEVYLE